MGRTVAEKTVSVERIKKLTRDFELATSIRVNFFDITGKLVVGKKPILSICGSVHKFPLLASRCRQFAQSLELFSDREFVIEKCHLGLNNFYIPFRSNGTMIGYFTGEPVFYSERSKKETAKKILLEKWAKERGADIVAAELEEVRVIPEERFLATVGLLARTLEYEINKSAHADEYVPGNSIFSETDYIRRRSEKRLRQLSTLFEVAIAITSQLELKPALQSIVDAITNLLKVDVCSIMLLDKDEKLKIAAATGLTKKVISETHVKVGQGICGWVVETSTPLLIPDIEKDEKFRSCRTKKELKAKSVLSVPIIFKDRIIGVINASSKTKRAEFTKDDLDLLQAVSSITAVVVENARLYEETEKRVKELEALNNVSNIVASTLELDKLLKIVVDLISDLMKVEICSVMLLDPMGQKLRIFVAHGIPKEIIDSVEVKVGEGISGWVAKTGRALLIKDVNKDRRFRRHSSVGYSTTSALSVPLKVKDRVIGVINVNNKTNNEIFTESDKSLLETLATQISSAIDNAQLYTRTTKNLRELEMLQQLGLAINSTLERGTVLRLLVDNVLKIFEADKGSLMLYDETTDSLRIMVSRGIDEQYVNKVSFRMGEGVAGYAALKGEPILVPNTAEDSIYKKFDSEPPKSLICAPIFIKGRVAGVLNCERTLEKNGPFTQENLTLLTTISTQAATAIENANLYNDLLTVYLNTIQSLAAAIDAKDSYTHGHSKRVAQYAMIIAREMGMSDDELETLKHTALLHDIGKIGISESILLKPGSLTEEEFRCIKNHPVVGAHILQSIEFLKEVRQQLRYHHERFDGRGYPEGLRGDEIPLGSRIIAVADTFDAITSTRPYRKGMLPEFAIEEIKRNSGTQFDPRVVECFLRVRDKLLKVRELEAMYTG